jgi:hypothetical protein
MPPMVRSDAVADVDAAPSPSAIEKPPDAARRGADAVAARTVAFDPMMRMAVAS